MRGVIRMRFMSFDFCSFFCFLSSFSFWYRNLSKLMMRATGGTAFSVISIRSRPRSIANFRASSVFITPRCLPASSSRRTSFAVMPAFLRFVITGLGCHLWKFLCLRLIIKVHWWYYGALGLSIVVLHRPVTPWDTQFFVLTSFRENWCGSDRSWTGVQRCFFIPSTSVSPYDARSGRLPFILVPGTTEADLTWERVPDIPPVILYGTSRTDALYPKEESSPFTRMRELVLQFFGLQLCVLTGFVRPSAQLAVWRSVLCQSPTLPLCSVLTDFANWFTLFQKFPLVVFFSSAGKRDFNFY